MRFLTFTLCFILGYFTNSLIQPIFTPNSTTIGIIGYKPIASLIDKNRVNSTNNNLLLKDFNISSKSKFMIRKQNNEIITSWIDQNGKKHTEITEVELIQSAPSFVIDTKPVSQLMFTWHRGTTSIINGLVINDVPIKSLPEIK